MSQTTKALPESPDLSETRQEITPERLALAVQRVSTDLMRHLNEMAEATFTPNLFRQDVEDLGIVLSALAAASAEREEAVRNERRACAQIADDEANKSEDTDLAFLASARIARTIRSRPLPSGADDGQ